MAAGCYSLGRPNGRRAVARSRSGAANWAFVPALVASRIFQVARGTKGALRRRPKSRRVRRSRSIASGLLPPHMTYVRELDPTGHGRWRKQAAERGGRRRFLLLIGLASPPRPLDDFTPGAEARPGNWVFDRAFSASGASAPHPDRGTPPEPPPFIFVPRAAGKRCYRLQPWCYARGGQDDSAVYDAPHFPLPPLSSMGRGPG